MSTRYNLTLVNKETKQEIAYHQLFGNNDWFPHFKNYLNTLSKKPISDCDHFDELVIPNITDFIRAIDETIVHDIIEKEPIKKIRKETSDKSFSYEYYHSPITDFSTNVMSIVEKTDTNITLEKSLFQSCHHIMNLSYLFSSYSIYLWLRNNNALLDNNKIGYVMHDYVSHERLTLSPELKPEFELQIGYW